MRKFHWVMLIILFVIFAVVFLYFQGFWPFSGGRQEEPQVDTGININQLAPDFTLELINGQSLSLSDLRGKKVFLNFWATWCPPCKAEMPDIQKLYNNYPDIEILAVNLREAKGTVAEFLLLNGYSFPVVLDKNGQVAELYQVRGIPSTYILNEKGIITDKQVGALSYEKMVELIKQG